LTDQDLTPFSGRVIFDHLPKTAGQAVNKWLRDELGSAVVTENLIGEHRDLIHDYGGSFSVISGHIAVIPGEGLDFRYHYTTLLREPIDRTLSWISFLLTDVPSRSDSEALIDGAKTFILTNGMQSNSIFIESITSPYTEHLWKLSTSFCENNTDKISAALKTLNCYSVVGLYEEISRFLTDMANFIEIPVPVELEKVNASTKRINNNEISQELRDRLIELNSLDIELYQRVKAWKEEQWSREIEPQSARTLISLWSKYDLPPPRQFCMGDILMLDPILNPEYDITQGQLLTFEVPFLVTRPIQELEMGIHIFDTNKKWVFGTNSTLLKQVQHNVETGGYRVFHRIIADLPVGTYTAGFAFAERTETGVNELYWTDVACEFRVSRAQTKTSVGYVDLPATINLIRDGNT
jgi:hypothetical protein